MKTLKCAVYLTAVLFLSALTSCKKQDQQQAKADNFVIDSTKISAFFTKHPDFKDYSKDIMALYRERNFRYVWYDKDGRNDFSEVLYNRASQIGVEGVPAELPYLNEFQGIFTTDSDKPDFNRELLISSMYFFYAKKVYEGLDPQKSKQLGWYLPRERVSYVQYLEELIKDPDLISKDKEEMIEAYYNLRKSLEKYRDIRDNGGWGKILLPEGKKSLKPGDNNPAVAQLRTRLHLGGYLASDSKNPVYDDELRNAIFSYCNKQNLKEQDVITKEFLRELNIPIEARIKTILVNMERCRWLSPDIFKSGEYIAVNIPSFDLRYVRDGKTALESNVVVGSELNKTVIFSGKMSYLVFSPFWNVPKSIIAEEVMPGIEKDRDYLSNHDMDWNDGDVRQRPGEGNSLGLVKFMFPNQNNIYLHDTPAKSLFKKDDRALSHGCIRVEKARELALTILSDDKKWTPSKIDEAMHSGTELNYGLKKKIPVYIAYFTAVADASGNVAFFDDVYNRDLRLAHMLYDEEITSK